MTPTTNLHAQVAVLFLQTLTIEQRASLKALLSFAGTSNMLRRALDVPPVLNQYASHVARMMLDRGWSATQVRESLDREAA